VRHRRPSFRDVAVAEAWLLSQLALPQPDVTVKRLRLLLDALMRYKWMAEEFTKWYAEQAAIDAPPK